MAFGITSMPGANTNPEVKFLQSVFLGIPHLAHKSQVHTGLVGPGRTFAQVYRLLSADDKDSK